MKNFSSINPKIGLFYANDPTDIANYRAGYYVGLKLVGAIAKDMKISDKVLLKIPRREFETMSKRWLRERLN